jgi:MYXO-CTERM domain-containing protein
MDAWCDYQATCRDGLQCDDAAGDDRFADSCSSGRTRADDEAVANGETAGSGARAAPGGSDGSAGADSRSAAGSADGTANAQAGGASEREDAAGAPPRAETSGVDETSTAEAEDDPAHVEHGCSTAPSAGAGGPGWLLLIGTALLAYRARRRAS